jgi:hypothetical protein
MRIDPVSIFLRGIFGPGFPLWVDVSGSYCTPTKSKPMSPEDIARLECAQDGLPAWPLSYDYKASTKEAPSGSG